MLRWLLTLLLLLGPTPASAGSSVTYGLTADSPTLGRTIRYALYLPGDAPAPDERWPVVYLLHGLGAADAQWFESGELKTMLDDAIANGTIQPMVIVAPFADKSWYVDSSPRDSYGPVATAFATDLIAAIDASLPTVACRAGRAVAGISMGGVGAVLLAIARPDLYYGAVGYSPAIHPPVAITDLPPGALPDLYGGVFGDPFDPVAYNAANAFTRVETLWDSPMRPEFYFTIGDDDYPELIEDTVAFHLRLKAMGVSSTLRMSPGAHDWDFWRGQMIPGLAWLSDRLTPRC